MRRWLQVLFVLCLVIGLLEPVRPCAVQGDTVYVRKHVSILYDNSGSMKEGNQSGENNLKWCYASYAAQVFTGLLNDTDSLSITFMDGAPLKNLNLDGLRQDAVSAVYDRTTTANADTPISQIGVALSVLQEEGLQAGLGANAAGEQYWLVLTTDGVFRENSVNLSVERVTNELESILEKYPDLHVVYFGIGTQNDNSASKAVDFRDGSSVDKALLDRLHSHPNFTAVYAESQEQIVATMQALSNQISGRYSVSNNYEVVGNQIRIYLSGEGSPIRNIAVMAQETNAKLLSATAEDGSALVLDREAQIRYPYNAGYSNVPNGTLGGYVALITGRTGEKLPNGTVTLTFSEPIDKENISLMYEPAIHIQLAVERKTIGGQWETVPEYQDLAVGDEVRVGYTVCEDETGVVLDTGKLFGKTEATILYNGKELKENETVIVTEGEARLDARVSMMDGGYQISTSRTIHVGQPGAGDFTVTSAGPIELRRSEAAENTEKYIEFTVLLRGEPADASFTEKMELKADVSGRTEKPADHVFRFIPQDADCTAGTYMVQLLYEGDATAKEEILILPNEVTYSAEAGPSISILSNHVSDNDSYVTFTVTAHRDEGDTPITAEEAALFTVRSERGGQSFSGHTAFLEGGVITFTPQDAAQTPGDYSVSLWKDDQKLAETAFSVIHYDATYAIETVISDPNTVDRFALQDNQACVCFIIYEDGIPCTPAQLEAMLDRQLQITSGLNSSFAKLDVTIGVAAGKPAIICTPTSTTSNGLLLFFRRVLISTGLTGLNRGQLRIDLKVDMPHGDEASGVLDLTGYRVIYLIVFLAFLALLLLVFFFIFANCRARRLMRGSIWTFTMQQDAAGALSATPSGVSEAIGWGWKPMLLIPRDETHSISGVQFRASPPKTKHKHTIHLPNSSRRNTSPFRFKRQHPLVVVEGTEQELQRYYYADVSDTVAPLLNQIRAGGAQALRAGNRRVTERSFFLGNSRLLDDVAPKVGVSSRTVGSAAVTSKPSSAKRTATKQLSTGKGMIYTVSKGERFTNYTVWVYEAFSRSNSGDASGKRYLRGMGNPPVKKTKKERTYVRK